MSSDQSYDSFVSRTYLGFPYQSGTLHVSITRKLTENRHYGICGEWRKAGKIIEGQKSLKRAQNSGSRLLFSKQGNILTLHFILQLCYVPRGCRSNLSKEIVSIVKYSKKAISGIYYLQFHFIFEFLNLARLFLEPHGNLFSRGYLWLLP